MACLNCEPKSRNHSWRWFLLERLCITLILTGTFTIPSAYRLSAQLCWLRVTTTVPFGCVRTRIKLFRHPRYRSRTGQHSTYLGDLSGRLQQSTPIPRDMDINGSMCASGKTLNSCFPTGSQGTTQASPASVGVGLPRVLIASGRLHRSEATVGFGCIDIRSAQAKNLPPDFTFNEVSRQPPDMQRIPLLPVVPPLRNYNPTSFTGAYLAQLQDVERLATLWTGVLGRAFQRQ